MTRRPLIVWGCILGAAGLYDLHCARNDVEGDTLSEVLRDVFGVETPAGRAAFCAAWAALGGWFVPHILKKTAEST